MKQKIITELEQEQTVRIVKKGDISSLNSSFIESFHGTIASCYRLYRCNESNFNFEDFQQECLIGVIKALKSFKCDTYGELRSFVKTTIKNISKDAVEKHKNQSNYNILGGDSEEVQNLSARRQKYWMETEVVDRLTVEHIIEKFIIKELTKKQLNVAKAFYLEECPRKYELKNGMKPRSFDKALDRVLKKIGKIIKTEEFKEFYFLSVLPKCMITE